MSNEPSKCHFYSKFLTIDYFLTVGLHWRVAGREIMRVIYTRKEKIES